MIFANMKYLISYVLSSIDNQEPIRRSIFVAPEDGMTSMTKLKTSLNMNGTFNKGNHVYKIPVVSTKSLSLSMYLSI